ncbi:hypothetical protein DUI87_15815 [Hirundo rustica rustica]|uniref:Uncharacterized protein n=1 Tax=Hirundo rustica rustica TaxID=333673 RepID=A0A3M0JZJ9_HIRRU|nr:hypothetical protein DUI87_15815 [Hirundo rustica rustica]
MAQVLVLSRHKNQGYLAMPYCMRYRLGFTCFSKEELSLSCSVGQYGLRNPVMQHGKGSPIQLQNSHHLSEDLLGPVEIKPRLDFRDELVLGLNPILDCNQKGKNESQELTKLKLVECGTVNLLVQLRYTLPFCKSHRQPFQGGDCAPSLPCGSFGNLNPTTQRPLQFRGVQRSISTLRVGLSLLPTLGIATGKSTFVVALVVVVAKAVMALPAPQEVSWTPVLPSTVKILGPKSQLESCWLLTTSTEAEP